MARHHDIYETLRFHVFLCLLASIFVSLLHYIKNIIVSCHLWSLLL